MKATGIVRRIDDLGRVVIPKEIRRTMKIREGAPLEIFTDAGGSVIFRKYSQVGEESGAATQMCEAMYKTSGRSCAICDLDSVVAASGPHKRELDGKALAPELEQAMQQRQLITRPRGGLEVASGAPAACVAAPIIAGGDLCGCVLMMEAETPPTETDVKAAQLAATFFGKQMEG